MNNNPVVSLFIPCLVDQVYPEIGIAMAKVLKHLGCQITYNKNQTCCGQPAFNAGHRKEARKVVRSFIDTFQDADVIVGPSGSCTAMVKNYYPVLFNDNTWYDKASHIGIKIFEFSQFIESYKLTQKLSAAYEDRIGFHNSCHSRQELGITSEPVEILNKIKNLEVVLPEQTSCCGFGGLFSIKFDEIGSTMAKTRIESFTKLNLSTIVTNDPGCLMHMRQEAKHLDLGIKIYHLTEFLAKLLNL